MNNSYFITGTGTNVGKTVVSAIVAEALEADYWKPVQAGFANGTDSEWVAGMLSNKRSVIYPEVYKLRLAASPHIAAREENININLQEIVDRRPLINNLIIEGAGGLMVPLNEDEFVIDLVKSMRTRVILVSRNELGSINHSLLTASICRQQGIDVAGWIFNSNFMNYENEIVRWSGIPKLGSIPYTDNINKAFIAEQAAIIRNRFNVLS